MPTFFTRDILHIDLTGKVCGREPLPPELLHGSIGGRALAATMMADFANLDPFSADMPLILCTGPLCGTPVPMSARATLTSRSPKTGGIFCSSAGGSFYPLLCSAGIMAIRITGRSERPLLLEISNSGAELLPADRLWGKGCHESFAALPSAALLIGPAGEQQLPDATLESSDGDPFSRGGLGAVMGYKGLKGIHIRTGLKPGQIADQARFEKGLEDLMRLFRASPFLMGPFGIKQHGTAALVDLMKSRGMLPGKRFASFSGDESCFNAAALHKRYNGKGGGCHDCLIACKRYMPDGTMLPDYDQLAAFGGVAGLFNLDAIVSHCAECRDKGYDPVAAAWQLAGGEPLSVKGLELPPYDPRSSTALALSLATSPFGATHLTAWPIASEILRKPVPTDRFSFDGKGRIITMFEDTGAAVDSLALCRFVSAAAELEELAALLSAVTGISYSAAELAKVGRETIRLEHDFNCRSGFIPQDDDLPPILFQQPANGLPPVDRKRFQQELAAYRNIRDGAKR